MSEELKDLRCKISTLSACYLEAEARSQGLDKCQLVRQVLDEWAKSRHMVHMTAQRLLAAEGLTGENEGSSGRQRSVATKQPLRWDDA